MQKQINVCVHKSNQDQPRIGHQPIHLHIQIRNVRKNAKEDRKAGMSTEAVIDKHVLGAPPHLLPILKDSALRREVQRVVEVKGERDWPCTIDISLFG